MDELISLQLEDSAAQMKKAVAHTEAELAKNPGRKGDAFDA